MFLYIIYVASYLFTELLHITYINRLLIMNVVGKIYLQTDSLNISRNLSANVSTPVRLSS